MSYQIIKQPSGKYAVLSSIIDDFIMVNETPDKIVSDWESKGIKNAAERVSEIITSLENGGKPYAQFTISWQESLDLIGEMNGEQAVQNLLKEVQ